MPSPTRCIIIRHGETVDNAARRVQGQLPGALNGVGIAQAQAAGRRLQQHDFSVIYSSDLERAHHTARLIAEQTSRRILLDQRLRERHFGILQGMSRAESKTKYPDIWRKRKGNDPDFAIPGGGESLRQLSRRALPCFEEIPRKHPGETVVVVTHGGVLAAFMRYVLHIPLDAKRHFRVQNTSWNLFSHKKEKWTLETWGDISHLEG